MSTDNIFMQPITAAETDGPLPVMEGQVQGTKIYIHSQSAGSRISFKPCTGFARILFLYSGHVSFDETECIHRAVYIAKPGQSVSANVRENCCIMELLFELNDAEFQEVLHSQALPYSIAYEDAPQYTEDCKSEKTISRMLVPPRLIPRFSMGSVETAGDDIVAQHTHPMLEQYFLGLAENDCTAWIDDAKVPFGGNILLHIPLGSNHGILSQGAQKVHYIWMDFLFDERGLAYMDAAHKML